MIKNPAEGWAILKERMVGEPRRYAAWLLGGKTIFTWRWDNIYNGDVYIYPMKRKGFEEHAGLTLAHWVMGMVHWPLFAAAWLLPVLLLFRSLRRKMPDILAGMPVMLTFLYAMMMLALLSPLPRYSIPYRPVAMLCATTALFLLARTDNATRRASQGRHWTY